MIKAGIVGGTGYAGVELIRLLLQHPSVELTCITSRSAQGIAVSDYFPTLQGHSDLVFSDMDETQLTACDVVFFSTPHGVAMEHAKILLAAGCVVIDLSADFRLLDPAEFKQWYQIEHACIDVLAQAVYGLPELNRDQIKQAKLIANPGCYPTASILPLMPLLSADIIDPKGIVIDAKSGVSGAGRGASIATLFSEISGNFKAYGVEGHRHLPEIKNALVSPSVSHETLSDFIFIPHLLPMDRGMEVTIYAKLLDAAETSDLLGYLKDFYQDECFVQISDGIPDTQSVKLSNYCRVGLRVLNGGRSVVITSVIDNLVKGASGQAIQNMNIIFNLPENQGLQSIASMP